MSKLQPYYLGLLKTKLQAEFVPYLPPLLDATKTPEQLALKNLSRAFSAFVLQHVCGISTEVAAQAVVDDFEDKGIDAIYYYAPTETLYLIQSKLKESEKFKQEEAFAFCQGVRQLIQQDITGFNQYVQERADEIENAVGTCAHIQLVIAHTGNGISDHARTVIAELLADTTHGEDRFCDGFIDYNAEQVVLDLQESQAPELIDGVLYIEKHSSVIDPRSTHFGLIRLLDLIDLYQQHGLSLYEKNIRTFLGKKTDVNSAIRRTLTDEPAKFFYLNNGITALASEIIAKGLKSKIDPSRRIEVKGFSIVNGAQTITSAAYHFRADNP